MLRGLTPIDEVDIGKESSNCSCDLGEVGLEDDFKRGEYPRLTKSFSLVMKKDLKMKITPTKITEALENRRA